MNLDQLHIAFETLEKSRGSIGFERRPDGTYIKLSIQRAWELFREGAEALDAMRAATVPDITVNPHYGNPPRICFSIGVQTFTLQYDAPDLPNMPASSRREWMASMLVKALLSIRDSAWAEAARREREHTIELRKALEPFARISAEGVVQKANGHVTVTTCAEYFHRAEAALGSASDNPTESA